MSPISSQTSPAKVVFMRKTEEEVKLPHVRVNQASFHCLSVWHPDIYGILMKIIRICRQLTGLFNGTTTFKIGGGFHDKILTFVTKVTPKHQQNPAFRPG